MPVSLDPNDSEDWLDQVIHNPMLHGVNAEPLKSVVSSCIQLFKRQFLVHRALPGKVR